MELALSLYWLTVNFGKNDSADVKLECVLNVYKNTSTLTTNDTNIEETSTWTIDI